MPAPRKPRAQTPAEVTEEVVGTLAGIYLKFWCYYLLIAGGAAVVIFVAAAIVIVALYLLLP